MSDFSENNGLENSIFFEIYEIVFAYQKLIIGLVLFGVVGSIVYSLMATPVYRAEVLMSPAASTSSSSAMGSSSIGGLARLAGVDLGAGNADVDVALAILRSRVFTEEFLRQNNYLPILFEEKWDQTNKKWKPKENLTSYQISQRFNKSIFIIKSKEDSNIRFIVEWKDPIIAAKWANEMIEKLNLYIKNQAIQEAEQNIFFLNKELEKPATINSQTALYSLIQDQTEKKMIASVREQYSFKIIDPALVPELRFKPKRKLIVIIGTIASLILSISIAFLHSFYGHLFKRNT